MDPASIIGLVSAAVALISASAKIANGLHDLTDKYNSTNSTLTNIIQQCRTLGAAVAQIKAWIENTLVHLPVKEREIMDPLNQALVEFTTCLKPLEEDVSIMLRKVKPSGFLPRKIKFQVVWNDANMKDHLDNLRWQAQAIDLTLNTTRLSVEEGARKMKGIAQAASQFREGSLFNDNGSTIDEHEFDFDNLLINTAAYRRALQSHLRHSAATPETPSSTPKPTLDLRPPAPEHPQDPDIMITNEVEEDLIDFSSERDVPVNDDVAVSNGSPSLDQLRLMEESQRWETRTTSDGRVFYWNSLTNAETSMAFEIGPPDEEQTVAKVDKVDIIVSATEHVSKDIKTAGIDKASPSSQNSIKATIEKDPLTHPSVESVDWTGFQAALHTGNISELKRHKAAVLHLNECTLIGHTSRTKTFKMASL